MSPSETERPPASTTAMVCAAASWRLQRREPAQRVLDRLDRAQVGARSDDLAAGFMQPAACLRELSDRLSLRNPVRYVVGADHDDGYVR